MEDRPGGLAPDLVLLDPARPVMDGRQSLPLLRQTAPLATIVVLSGFPAEAAVAAAFLAGAHGYLVKVSLVDPLIPKPGIVLERDQDTVRGRD